MQEILLVYLVAGRMTAQDIERASFKLSNHQNILLIPQHMHQLHIALISLKQLEPCPLSTLSTCLEWSQAHFC